MVGHFGQPRPMGAAGAINIPSIGRQRFRAGRGYPLRWLFPFSLSCLLFALSLWKKESCRSSLPFCFLLRLPSCIFLLFSFFLFFWRRLFCAFGPFSCFTLSFHGSVPTHAYERTTLEVARHITHAAGVTAMRRMTATIRERKDNKETEETKGGHDSQGVLERSTVGTVQQRPRRRLQALHGFRHVPCTRTATTQYLHRTILSAAAVCFVRPMLAYDRRRKVDCMKA